MAIYQRSTTKRLKNTRISPQQGRQVKRYPTQHHYRTQKKVTWAPSLILLHLKSGSNLCQPRIPKVHQLIAHKLWNGSQSKRKGSDNEIQQKHFQQATNHETKDKRFIKWMGEQLWSNDLATKLKCYESTPIQTPDRSNTQSTRPTHHHFTLKKDNK